MKKHIILISSLLLLLVNCDNSKNEENIYDDKQLITNIIENIVNKETKQFYDDAIKLHQLAEELNTNTTVANLESLKSRIRN